MTITRDVVTDLLPLYLAGEASPGTRALLEEYLRAHPGFAEEVRTRAAQTSALLAAAAAGPPPDAEKATFEKVRRFGRQRSYLMAFAIAFTLMPLSAAFTDRIRWFMLRDNPALAMAFWVAALGCWIGYLWMGRRLRTS
jgi:anti-sigma factor RsiW